jgi:small subunit ribosomal protein S6e
MAYKINISEKGKTWKVESEATSLAGKSIGDKIQGKDIKHELEGYELEITGGSDIAGFPISKDVEGIGLRRILLTKGWGFRGKSKKKGTLPKGMRIRKTVRGKVISNSIVQINMQVLKEGHKKLHEIFSEQNKAKEKAPKAAPAAPVAEAAA